jgi:hypothetical protein
MQKEAGYVPGPGIFSFSLAFSDVFNLIEKAILFSDG